MKFERVHMRWILILTLQAQLAARREGRVLTYTSCVPEDLVSNSVFTAASFNRCLKIDLGQKYVLIYWSVLPAESDYQRNITFAAQFPTTSAWVALGISTSGGMIGADMIVVRYLGTSWIAENRFATATSLPPLDTVQDVILLGASAANGVTSFQVQRPLVYCNSAMHISIEDTLAPLIFAYGVDGSYELAYHGFDHRGTVWVNLIEDTPPQAPPAGASVLEVRHATFSVPADDTTKYCYSSHVFPQDRKYHLVRAEPVLNSSHPELIHHMIIYSCLSEVSGLVILRTRSRARERARSHRRDRTGAGAQRRGRPTQRASTHPPQAHSSPDARPPGRSPTSPTPPPPPRPTAPST